MTGKKKIAALARQLFKLSFENGQLASERVAGVLQWVDKNRPANATALLRAYRRLVEAEIARGQAVIEFSGDVTPELFQQIAAAMSRRYSRPVSAVPVPRPNLIAGIRVRVGDDIYENSLLQQLAALNPSA